MNFFKMLQVAKIFKNKNEYLNSNLFKFDKHFVISYFLIVIFTHLNDYSSREAQNSERKRTTTRTEWIHNKVLNLRSIASRVYIAWLLENSCGNNCWKRFLIVVMLFHKEEYQVTHEINFRDIFVLFLD